MVVRTDVPLAPLTTLGLGGAAKRFVRATTIDELRALGAKMKTDGLAPIASGTTTDNGLVTAASNGALRTVTLDGPDLTITHLAGTAFGSAILNAGSDRAIDTQTAVSIDLSNAGPDVLGSSMFKIQDLAIATAALRAQ